MAKDAIKIVDTRHPVVYMGQTDWELWRRTYEGGVEFRNTYLKQFTQREETTEFNDRKAITPIPTFAKAALNDIRNAIFQRMRDILRRGGSESYQRAINGLSDGVDRRGSTMNAFLGMKVLTDLLVMGRVGVYVDAPIAPDVSTLAEAPNTQPYLYQYAVEDILNWKMAGPDKPSQFQAVLLRDTTLEFDQRTLLPTTTGQRYRLMWIDDETGNVMLQFYNLEGLQIGPDGIPATEPIMLELKQIPFVMLDIEDSLLKDVCYYQIALLNLVSSDVNYALKANFPFLVEQRDLRATGAHLKRTATAEGTASTGGQGAADEDIKVGVTHGRAYDKGMNPPGFINPSAEPLNASLNLQTKLENDIRRLINLAVANIGAKATAAAPTDNQGLEAGLSYIGLVLENAERQIASYWAAYEQRNPKRREIATIKYPDRYSLKTDADRVKEAESLSDLMYAVPGRTVKKELGKLIVTGLLAGKVDLDTLQKIEKEIDAAEYTTSDPSTIIEAKNAGLVGDKTASQAIGFSNEEYQKAREDHIARIKRIAETQGVAAPGSNPAARGVSDLAADTEGAREEKELSRETDLEPTTTPRVRGRGRKKKGK
jgi:hypothetical protein